MRLFALGLVFIVLYGAHTANAAPLLNADKPDWFYVAPDSLPPTLLPPPPKPNSPELQREIEVVLKAQKDASPFDKSAAKDEQHVRLELMTQVLGDDFTRDAKPKTFALLDRVMTDTKTLTENDKNFWHTKRPYLVDQRVKLGVDPLDNSPAYPSGHTCFARVVAEVLGMIYPDHLADLRSRADAIAWHRVQAGVHYLGDLDGGKLLAMQIIGSLVQNDKFQSDLKDARQEAATAR
jgi:acid phosphatase (class A)